MNCCTRGQFYPGDVVGAIEECSSMCSDGVGLSTSKPPYSYAELITMAMRNSVESRLTLADIYRWISDNFEYYRSADPSWQVNGQSASVFFEFRYSCGPCAC